MSKLMEEFKKVTCIVLEAYETSTRDGKTEYYYKPSGIPAELLLGAINAQRGLDGLKAVKSISHAKLKEVCMARAIGGNELEVRVAKVNNLVPCSKLEDGQVLEFKVQTMW